jgi:benzoylformate decarboxylase
VAELAQRLLAAENPPIIVGDEVAWAGAVGAVVQVAERCGTRVIGSTTHELCFPMNRPLWCGSTGHLFGEAARPLLAGSDCVISVGGVDVSAVFPTCDPPTSEAHG